MRFGELSPDAAAGRLRVEGCALRFGPFVLRARTNDRRVVEFAHHLYCHHELVDDEFADATIAVHTAWDPMRPWRRKARMFLDDAPFIVPLPGFMAGPMLEWGLNWVIASRAHAYLQIHAGAVEKNGRTVVLPAASGSGKSTLCANLTSSGWRLFSDEFAVIALDTGELVPMPRGVSLKNESIAIAQQRHAASEFSRVFRKTVKGDVSILRAPRESVQRAEQRCPPGAIVFPKWSSGSDLTVKPVSRSETLKRVVFNSINYTALGELGFKAVIKLVEGVPAYELTYSDTTKALAWFDAMASEFR